MNFVGKILVVVQVVFALCFMAFAGAVFTAQTNWKEEAASLEENLNQTQQELQGRISTLQKDKQQLESQVADLEDNIRKLEGNNEGLQQELTIAKQDLERTKSERDQALQEAELAQEEAGERRREAQLQRSINGKLHSRVEDLVGQVRSLKDDIFHLERDNESYIAQHEQVLEELAFKNKVIRQAGLSTDPEDYQDVQSPPPDVRGRVLNARRETDRGIELVEISIGSDDGLSRGHSLYVYRSADGGQYLGEIEIVHVTPNRAVGSVISRAKNGIIQRGDNVTTKL